MLRFPRTLYELMLYPLQLKQLVDKVNPQTIQTETIFIIDSSFKVCLHAKMCFADSYFAF